MSKPYSGLLLFLRRVMIGLRAFTVQFYTEANVKNGLQFETTWDIPTLAAGATNYFVFRTGSKPCLIKTRIKSFTGAKLTTALYKNPTGFSGTPTVTGIYNLSDINPQSTTVLRLANATVATPGTQLRATMTTYGSESLGNRAVAGIGLEGLEFNCAANTTYVLTTTNASAEPCSASNYITWYEGEPDLPKAEGVL